jgi:pectin methylesterase-like acyl-CoA thioesterase
VHDFYQIILGENCMYKRSKKVISRLLAFIMLATAMLGAGGVPVMAGDTTTSRSSDVWDFGGVIEAGSTYTNHISVSTLNGLSPNVQGGWFKQNTTFGDLTVVTPGNYHRLYYTDGTANGALSYGSPTTKTFPDGYANKGAIYNAGSGDDSSKYIRIDHVTAGDVIELYGFNTNSSSEGDPTINVALTSSESGAITTKVAGKLTSAGQKFTYLAADSGYIKIYFTNTGSFKPNVARIIRTPGVKVSGTLNLNGFALSGHSLVFQNQTTSDILKAALHADGTFDATLNPGYSYTAVLQGVSSEYSISDSSKTVTAAVSDIGNGIGNITLEVARMSMAKISGNITGFDNGYDLSNLKLALHPPEGSLAPVVQAVIDQTAMTYSAEVRTGEAYKVAVSGVNDYELSGESTLQITADTVQDIAVSKKALYTANGAFVGLSSSVTVSSLQFTNLQDNYKYAGTVTGSGSGADGGYTVSLRDGAYAVTAVLSDTSYSTIGHVVVSGGPASKDIKFTTSTAPSALPLVQDLYVGDSSKEHNFATIKEALADAARMNPASEAQRITIHIAPGIYRDQLKIETPYISLVNTDPSKEVKITWYYGVGYVYYSADKGYYNEDRAFDKYAKSTADKWGATVYLTNKANGFRAENIVFENSFNKYVTQEELNDGVQPDPVNPTNTTVRTLSLDARSRGATERAAAIAIESDNTEFYKCSFLSNQDTLYTGNTNQYFKDSFIEGNTDYIFGAGNVVFDNCILNFTGYSDQDSGGYITAAKPSNGSDPSFFGYLFRDCIVTNTGSPYKATGSFGRPWGQDAKVTFLDTRLQNSTVISPEGWAGMSNSTPENAYFYEYNTTYNGERVDTSARRGRVLSSEAAVTDVTRYFGSDWTPKYYTPGNITAPVLNVSSTTQSQVALGWQASTSSIGSVIYTIYQDGQKLGTTTELGYTAKNLAPSTSYSFKVTAVNTAGNTEASAEVQATTSEPGIPSAPSASGTAGNGSATVSWNTVTEATYYTVKGLSGGTFYPVYTITEPTVTSYTYSGLTNGVPYQFAVTASNSFGESALSNVVTVTPTAEGSIPSAPVISARAGGTTATVSWNAVSGAAAYTVKGGRSADSFPMVQTVSAESGTSYTFAGLTYGTTYYFTVTASNPDGESAGSNVVSATPGQDGTIQAVDFNGFGIGETPTAGSARFDDDTNVFTVTGSGTGIDKNLTGKDRIYLNAVKIKGDYTISAKVAYSSGQLGNMGLTIRESLDPNSFHYTQAATATGGRKMFRYTGKSNGSNTSMPIGGTAYLQISKSGDKITSILSSAPIPEFPVPSSTLAVSTETAKNLGLDENGNAKELYAGLMVTSANANSSLTAVFEDVKIVMADGTVAFDSNEGKPVAPKNVTAKPYDKSALLTWDALATATSYTVKYSTDEAGPFTQTHTVSGTEHQAMISGLANDRPYYFVVTASNASGESVNSGVVEAVPSAASVLPPVIMMTSAEPSGDVFSALLPLSGSVNKDSILTIRNNGSFIKLDGEKTSLSLAKDGVFSTTSILEPGVNEIEIKAVDTYGNTTTKLYTVTYTYKAGHIGFYDTDDLLVTALAPSKELVIKAEVENHIAASKEAVLAVGLYDGHNNLVKLIFTAETLYNGETEMFYAKLKLPEDVSGYTVKAFVWDSVVNMQPLSDVIVLK